MLRIFLFVYLHAAEDTSVAVIGVSIYSFIIYFIIFLSSVYVDCTVGLEWIPPYHP